MAGYSDLLCQLMAEKGMSVGQLSVRAKVSKQTITNMRMGHDTSRVGQAWRPRADIVARLATALGEPVEKWLAMTGQPQLVAAELLRKKLIERLEQVDNPMVFAHLNRYLDRLLNPDSKPVTNPKPAANTAQPVRPAAKPAIPRTGHVRKKDGPPMERQPVPQPLFTHAKAK